MADKSHRFKRRQTEHTLAQDVGRHCTSTCRLLPYLICVFYHIRIGLSRGFLKITRRATCFLDRSVRRIPDANKKPLDNRAHRVYNIAVKILLKRMFVPMTIYDELVARGLIAQVTNEEEIKTMINAGKATFYIGFDCTADSRPPDISWH